MTNLFVSDEEREFFVWVDPSSRLVEHNMRFTGSFVAIGNEGEKIPFIPNPNWSMGMISPFQLGITRNYIVEHNLEINRERRYADYPSRLEAMYLLNSVNDARRYAENNSNHISGRVLKRAITVGKYKYSIHDSAWINFLRMDHSISDEDIGKISDCYWENVLIEGCELKSHGQPYSAKSFAEVLFLGRIDFSNRGLKEDDV